MRKNEPQTASSVADAILVGLARKRSNQGKLAEHLQLSQPAIHRRMTGKVSWRISELAEVADFLGISITELINEHTEASAS